MIALPNEGYTFVNWMESGVVIATNPIITFIIKREKELVTNFDYISSSELLTFSNIILYPNPFNSHIFVSNTHKIEKIQIINIFDQVKLDYKPKGFIDEIINTNGLPTGLYFVKILDNLGRCEVKIIVKE